MASPDVGPVDSKDDPTRAARGRPEQRPRAAGTMIDLRSKPARSGEQRRSRDESIECSEDLAAETILLHQQLVPRTGHDEM